jgi:ketosteroid isomerase-like protein
MNALLARGLVAALVLSASSGCATAGAPEGSAARPTAVAAASETRAAPLTDAEIRGFMQSVAAAARARDVPRLAALLADDAEIALTTRMQGVDRTNRISKADYVALLDRGYLAMKDLEAYEYDIVEMQVALDGDGRAATVESQVVETVTLDGRRHSTRSHETTRIERRQGRPIIVGVAAMTSAE